MLFRNRQKGDYADFVRFDQAEVKPWYNEAKKFVQALEMLVRKEVEEGR